MFNRKDHILRQKVVLSTEECNEIISFFETNPENMQTVTTVTEPGSEVGGSFRQITFLQSLRSATRVRSAFIY